MIMKKITKKVTYGYSVFYRMSSSCPRIYSINGKSYRTKSIREELLSNALDILLQLDCEIVQIRRYEHIGNVSVHN